MPSVQKVLSRENDTYKYLVYLKEFSLIREYRQHTWVAVMALRQLCNQVPLKDPLQFTSRMPKRFFLVTKSSKIGIDLMH